MTENFTGEGTKEIHPRNIPVLTQMQPQEQVSYSGNEYHDDIFSTLQTRDKKPFDDNEPHDRKNLQNTFLR